MRHNWRTKYLVMINENTNVSVYKNEKCKIDEPFLSFQAKNIFIGKSGVCYTTEASGALDNPDFDGNTILLECVDNKYVYISGYEIFEFKTDDKILKYISLMGNNMIPYTIGVGEKYTYFISERYKFIENDKIEEGTLLNTTNNNIDPYEYHLEKCGIDSFKKLLECNRLHSFWLNIEDDMEELVGDDVEENDIVYEQEYTVGTNEVVRIYNQKCVICFERDSEYIFKQCGHQCICQDCYQNKGNIDILKCVICRT